MLHDPSLIVVLLILQIFIYKLIYAIIMGGVFHKKHVSFITCEVYMLTLISSCVEIIIVTNNQLIMSE